MSEATAHHHYQPGRPHWWQWLTVLSLDAPLVAVAWQNALAHAAQVSLRWHHGYILGASVWLAYAADRWIEGWRLVPGQILTQRHWFYQRWRWPVAVVWLAVLLTALVCTGLLLSRRELAAGLLLLGPVLIYLLSHQLLHLHHPKRLPKEICVALLFAAGAVIFIGARRPASIALIAVPLVLFAALCFANCSLISIWENEVDLVHGQTSLALQFPQSQAMLRLLPWGIALAGLIFALFPGHLATGPAWCAAVSGTLLGLVDRIHRRLGRQLARALADVALMTPLLLGLGRWFTGP